MSQETDASQEVRDNILRKAGINPKQQQVAVFTLQQIQGAMLEKLDEVSINYLRKWERGLPKNPKHFMKWMKEHDAIFYAAGKDKDPITGWNKLTYVYGRKPDFRRAFEVSTRVQPVLGTGNVKLEVEHQEIAFPKDHTLKLA